MVNRFIMSSIRPRDQERQCYSTLHLKECLQQVSGCNLLFCPYLGHCVQFWVSWLKINRKLLERAKKIMRDLEHIPYEERLSNPGLISLGSKMRRNLIITHKLLICVSQADGARFSSVVQENIGQWVQTGTQEDLYEHEENFFILRVTEIWNKLPREATESPSLRIVKTHLDTFLCNSLKGTCYRGEVGLDDPPQTLQFCFCHSLRLKFALNCLRAIKYE